MNGELIKNITLNLSEAYLVLCQTSTMELICKNI